MSASYRLTPMVGRPYIFYLSGSELDPQLCPGGELKVIFGGGRKRTDDVGTGPDAFQHASVEAFVTRQDQTRRRLEQAMNTSRAEACANGDRNPPPLIDLWTEAKVKYLYLPPKRTLTVEQLLGQWRRVVGKAPDEAEELEMARQEVAKADTEETQTRFVVGISVVWDDEHGPYNGVVRDGELVAFGPEEL